MIEKQYDLPYACRWKGAGLLGVYASVILRERRLADNIYCCDVDENRLKMIEQFGAKTLKSSGEETNLKK